MRRGGDGPVVPGRDTDPSPEGGREVTVARVQEDGTCWCGTTVWQGHTAMRVSVISWDTTEDDVDRSLEAILRIARSR